MPRFAPLPLVSIDPRNESELAQQAAQVVYRASNQTLNDFSAGNPLAVLVEGQAFAQGEFLFWANQLPEKILIEWIGPFLGAMRKLGTPATALLEATITPSDRSVRIAPGTVFSTDPQITNGQSFEFISYVEVAVPPGATKANVPVYSKFVGTLYNVPANSITSFSNVDSRIEAARNPYPASGGTEVETYEEVKQRFFTLIRRRNPVSESDWKDFFEDLYGPGTLTSVQPNRSSEFQYSYDTDYASPNGQVAFFVLGPDGVELTDEQIRLGQNAVNFSVPIENQGKIYPIRLSPVHYQITLSVDPNGRYGRDFQQSSLNFRNRLFNALQPGLVFSSTANPTVSDVDSAFYSSFDAGERFVDPRVVESAAYNTPNLLDKNVATYTSVYEFEPSSSLLKEGDLVSVNAPNPTYYPCLTSFTPYSSRKSDQTLYGNLKLKQIKRLSPGNFVSGDVVYYDGSLNPEQEGLHVVLESLSVMSNKDIASALESGRISGKKEYRTWEVGEEYIYSENGKLNPDIVEYDYEEGAFIPREPSSIPLNQRPGSLVWVVASNFTLEPTTNDITGAQLEFKLGSDVEVRELSVGESYSAGDWVMTRQVGSGPNAELDPDYHYIDTSKGGVVKYAKVITSFSLEITALTMTERFDTLVKEGVLREVKEYKGENGLPVYLYKSRFKTGQYLEFRDNTFAEPQYFISAEHFTPPSSNVSEMQEKGLIINLTPTEDSKAQFSSELEKGFSGQVGSLIILDPGSGYGNGTYSNVPLLGGDGSSATAQITVSEGKVTYALIFNRGRNYRIDDTLTVDPTFLGGSGSGLSLSVASIKAEEVSSLNRPARMFTFFQGDRTFFRNGGISKSFTATKAVSPLFDFSTYYRNGVFVETRDDNTEFYSDMYIPFNHPSYADYAEDTVTEERSRSLYRVMRAFTPSERVVTWKGVEEDNDCRFEEFSGNLLRYVTRYVCEDVILPQSGPETSSIKLGTCEVTILPKTQNGPNSNQRIVYLWENTLSANEVPSLSWFSGTSFGLTPPNYGEGTLAL